MPVVTRQSLAVMKARTTRTTEHEPSRNVDGYVHPPAAAHGSLGDGVHCARPKSTRSHQAVPFAAATPSGSANRLRLRSELALVTSDQAAAAARPPGARTRDFGNHSDFALRCVRGSQWCRSPGAARSGSCWVPVLHVVSR